MDQNTNNNTPDRNAPEGTAAPDAAAKPESQCPCKTGVLQLR